MIRFVQLCAMASLCICAVAVARTPGGQGSKRANISADAAIDASGRAVITNIKGVRGALADMLMEQLQARTYRPARLNGEPTVSMSRIGATVVLTPAGNEEMDVSIMDLTLGPWIPRLTPPHYPADMALKSVGGSALVVFNVGTGGKPENVRIEASDPRIEKTVRAEVPRWRFTPEIIGGSHSRQDVAVPVWFYPENNTSAPPTFSCPPIGSRPHVDAGANGCLERIEITFSRSR